MFNMKSTIYIPTQEDRENDRKIAEYKMQQMNQARESLVRQLHYGNLKNGLIAFKSSPM